MSARGGRAVDLNRWRLQIVRHLEDFPRQYAALENAMGAFGEEFDLQAFKQAFNTSDDLNAYNRVQALERAVGRVQNYVAELALAGSRLAQLPTVSADRHSPQAQQAFEGLREAKVIGGKPVPAVGGRAERSHEDRARLPANRCRRRPSYRDAGACTTRRGSSSAATGTG